MHDYYGRSRSGGRTIILYLSELPGALFRIGGKFDPETVVRETAHEGKFVIKYFMLRMWTYSALEKCHQLRRFIWVAGLSR
jgi:hypothetical protein